jgi:hypothetical protein
VGICRIAIAAATLLIAANRDYADTLNATATVRLDNSLIVDIQVTTSGKASKLFVNYQSDGVGRLVSRLIPVSESGPTTITIGRLRPNRTYSYNVRAIDAEGRPAGAASGSFTTGPLPAPLLTNTYKLTGRTTVPLVIVPDIQPGFRGYVGLDLHSPDAPQIVWYYQNAPSNASGKLQVDTVMSIIRERDGNLLFADGGSGPTPFAADSFYREITPGGTVVAESPADCAVMLPTAPSSRGWIWGQGNNTHEQLAPGADGVPGTVLHLGRIVKDPFFDAGLAAQGTRLQSGTTIRRWNLTAGTDEVVWDPFDFLNPLTDRTSANNSDPGDNSDSRAPFPCAGASLQVEEWTHANSLQVAPTGVILMSVRHFDTVIAVSPQFDAIAWRIGRLGSDFSFPNPSDTFYHQHFARMLENGNLLLFDNGNGRPAAEGGQYSRALELALDWDSMTATKVWEYRHQLPDGTYKYADKVSSAQRLENGNTLVLFGTDIDPTTLLVKDPQVVTLVEADASPEAGAVAVLDMQIGNSVYRVLPVETLFGEVTGKEHD